MLYILLFIFIGIPLILTLINIISLILKNIVPVTVANINDTLIFLVGIPYTAILIHFIGFVEWNVQLEYSSDKFSNGAYTPIAAESLPTVITVFAIALLAYAVPRIFGANVPPFIAAFCYSGMFLGIGMTVMLFVQFGRYIFDLFGVLLLLLSFNYVICCIRLMRDTVKIYAEEFKNTEYDNPILNFCARVLEYSSTFILVSFILALPLLILIVITMLLFGQRPDSIIRAFTETAEYTLSQKIPPPRLDPQGHYLCTVAACGDEKVVKPLRAGKRYGRLIVVNRQLLVANAFEDLIAEKTPKFHKFIRGVYDKFGLPISKHITTKRRSNLVYFIMKPLEWLFVAVLYTFDLKPENRIAVQYTK